VVGREREGGFEIGKRRGWGYRRIVEVLETRSRVRVRGDSIMALKVKEGL
jgi:hypothetical protein